MSVSDDRRCSDRFGARILRIAAVRPAAPVRTGMRRFAARNS
jgi:hypothetical protein